MAITNVLSTFATEQPVLGNEHREVLRASEKNNIKIRWSYEPKQTLTIDCNEEGKNGVYHQGINARFAGSQTYNINGYTGHIFLRSIIQDATTEGGAFSITTEFVQDFNLPTNVDNPPNYTRITPLFRITEGNVAPELDEFYDNFRLSFNAGDTIRVRMETDAKDNLDVQGDSNIQLLFNLSGSAGGNDQVGVGLLIGSIDSPNTANGSVTRASFKNYANYSGATETVGINEFPISRTRGSQQEINVTAQTFNSVVRLTGDYQDSQDSNGSVVTNGRVTGRIIAGVGEVETITLDFKPKFDGRATVKNAKGVQYIEVLS